ncbi:MAG: hypothetical protein HC842_06745, partial [Cytophagales bacterium]|nr:hypothetical protein [Cytophagales bacterium]
IRRLGEELSAAQAAAPAEFAQLYRDLQMIYLINSHPAIRLASRKNTYKNDTIQQLARSEEAWAKYRLLADVLAGYDSSAAVQMPDRYVQLVRLGKLCDADSALARQTGLGLAQLEDWLSARPTLSRSLENFMFSLLYSEVNEGNRQAVVQIAERVRQKLPKSGLITDGTLDNMLLQADLVKGSAALIL